MIFLLFAHIDLHVGGCPTFAYTNICSVYPKVHKVSGVFYVFLILAFALSFYLFNKRKRKVKSKFFCGLTPNFA